MCEIRGRGKESNVMIAGYRNDPKRYRAYINVNFVFQGTHIDDMASAIFRVARPTRVLVLGASLASVLLPLSIFTNVQEVTLVDLEKPSSPLIDKLRKSIIIRVSVSDALDYLEKCNKQFDVIYVDMFTEDGYAEIVFDKRLYRAMHRKLDGSGAIVLNAYDIPCYLFPEIGSTVTVTLMNLLSDEFSEVLFLKHRRNSLLLAGNAIHQAVCCHETRPLSLIDGQRLQLARERAYEFRAIPTVARSVSPPWKTAEFGRIGRLLLLRTAALLGTCEARYKIGHWNSFHDLALYMDLQQPTILKALYNSEFLRHIVLIEIAAHMFSDPKTSLARLSVMLKSLHNVFTLSSAYRSQALVDVHAMKVISSDALRVEFDSIFTKTQP